jgi:hypothetical protein
MRPEKLAAWQALRERYGNRDESRVHQGALLAPGCLTIVTGTRSGCSHGACQSGLPRVCSVVISGVWRVYGELDDVG